MSQHIKELVQLAKKHNKMPVLIKQLQYDKSTWKGKCYSETQIIEMWYDDMVERYYTDWVWDDIYTFETEFMRTIYKWQYQQEKIRLQQKAMLHQ